MFKTIEECRLSLVAHTMAVDQDTGIGRADWLEDFLPCSAARVSFGKEDKTGTNPAADKKLMTYLAEHKHMSPFEHQTATFLVEVPLFIRSQIHRHRTFAYNEISRRYTEESLEFWIPTAVRKQSASNRQSSDGVVDEPQLTAMCFESQAKVALNAYNTLLQNGVCREQARALLPQSLLTKFYMSGNLRNWAHFIELRTEEHSQQEVQVVANRIKAKLLELWPTAAGVLLKDAS